jgi:hypothetical protein
MIVEKSLSEHRKEILEWAKLNLAGNSIKIKIGSVHQNIDFTTRGIKEALNQPHKFYRKKMRR